MPQSPNNRRQPRNNQTTFITTPAENRQAIPPQPNIFLFATPIITPSALRDPKNEHSKHRRKTLVSQFTNVQSP